MNASVRLVKQAPLSGPMKSCFTPLAASQRDQVVRLPIVFKPDSVGQGLAGQILRRLGEQLQARGISFRFTAPTIFQPTRELVDHLYYEHSGLDPKANFARTDKPKPFFADMYGPYMAGELPEMVQMPLISVIVEARAGAGFDTQSLIDIMRDLIGQTNPLAALRDGKVGPEEKEKIRYAFGPGSGARLAPVVGKKGYNVEGSPIYNRIHCPQRVDEAGYQLGLIYSQRLLSGHYDEATIRQLTDGLPRLKFEARPLLDCFEGEPGRTADSLIGQFPALAHMSHYEVELLVREFNLLAGYFLEREQDFHRSLGNEPLPVQLTKQPLPTPYIYLLVGASGVGKTTLIGEAKKAGLVDASLPQYTTSESSGQERVAITKEEAVELCAQNCFLAMQSAAGAPAYFFTRRAIEGFAELQGGRAVFDASEDQVRDIQAWAKQAGVVVRTGYLKLHNQRSEDPAGRDGLQERMEKDQTRDRGDRIEGSLENNRRLRAMATPGTFDRIFDMNKSPEQLVEDLRRWFAETEQPGAAPVANRLPDREHDSPRLFMLREWLKGMYFNLITHVVNPFYHPGTELRVIDEAEKEEEEKEPAKQPAATSPSEDLGLPGFELAEKPAEPVEDLGLPGFDLAEKPAEPVEDLGLPGFDLTVAAEPQAASPAATLPRIATATSDDFETAIKKGLGGDIMLWLYELHRYWHGAPPETAEQLKVLADTTEHTCQTLAAVMQGQLSFEWMLNGRKLSRYMRTQYSGLAGDQIEAVAFPLIRWTSERFTSEQFNRSLLDALVHDSGKPKQQALHERGTAEIVRRLKLPEHAAVFFAREDLELTEMVGAHHHTIGNTFLPDESLRDVLTTFEDPQVRARLTRGISSAIDLSVMEPFLTRLLITGMSDVAGGAIGNLSATGVVTYRRNYELLTGLARKHQGNYDAFLAAVGEAAADLRETQRRFAMAPARCDQKMDANNGLDTYWPMVEEAAKAVIASGELTQAEWEQALRLAPKVRRVEYFCSFLFSVMDPATNGLPEGLGTKGGATETELIKVNPNYIKYRVLLGKIAQAVEKRSGKDTLLIFEADASAREEHNFKAGSWLNQILNATPVGEIEVSCDGAGFRLANKAGETIVAGTIEEEPNLTRIILKI